MEAALAINQELFFSTYNLSGQNQIVDSLMIFAAKNLIYLAAFLSVVLAIRKDPKGSKVLILIFIAFIFGFILHKIFGILLYEPRPFLTNEIIPLISLSDDDSFPSAHTLILTIVTLSHVVYKTKYTWIMILCLVLTGFARIYVGIHYPVDILGGFLIGVIAVSLSWWIKNKFSKRFSFS